MQKNQSVEKIALVVGATGFIGKFLVARLLQSNDQVFALCRNLDQQESNLRNWLEKQEISHQKLFCIQGDVTLPALGISAEDWQGLAKVNYLFNTSALFAWNLSTQQAREVNVKGLINLLECVNEHCQLKRAIHLSGYMLTLTQHLQDVGVYLENIEKTNWKRVYQQLGAYEASKIEAHFTWVKYAQQLKVDWTVIHPATVLGDENSGEIAENQPIAHLITQLKQGKLTAIPATPQHYLPLVSVTMLVNAICNASQDQLTIYQDILIANPTQISLQTLIHNAAHRLNLKAPQYFVSLNILKLILKWKWLAQKLDLSAEMLDFIRTEQLNIDQFLTLNQKWKIPETNLKQTIELTAKWVSQNH
ncbi:SDR family oxidoreductase [Acinetobacter sp. ULE_I001]|uniref:SDR family oxidoreductase n=1 Tax=unclassified Acinetobacter TaxID=196816 RepID=UPI003AF87314